MKTQNAFALRGFDIDKFVQTFLSDCGLPPDALKNRAVSKTLAADKNDFDALQRARKSYSLLLDKLKFFRKKLIRHVDRLLKYQMSLIKDVGKLADEDYYFSFYKPRSIRLKDLSDKYTTIAQKLIEVEKFIEGIIYTFEQYQRSYYTKIFAQRLKEARKAAGLTQADLAAQIGVKRSSYTAFETARNEPNISVLALVSKELNLSPNWFLGL